MVVLFLEEAMPVLIFDLDAAAGGVVIQALALHDIGDAQLQWSDNTHMEDIAPISQHDLGATTDDDDMACFGSALHDVHQRLAVELGIHTESQARLDVADGGGEGHTG